jgi:NAD(P)-dependent dehydrogenase (short-subunit alcohol dehydrogenase family)
MTSPDPKVCLITGGASGLGRAASLRFARDGYDVVIGDLDAAGGEETAAQIRAAGGRATFVPTDVAVPADVQAFVDLAIRTHGRLDCAVNNAGVEGTRGFLVDYSEDEARRLYDINFMGVFTAMKHEIKAMLKTGGGAIVNVGSSAGLRGTPRMAAYCATKHALEGLTKSAALEYGEKGIRVNIIAPGSFRTPMSERLYGKDIDTAISSVTPLKRVGSVEEVAEAIYWLASPASSFVTGASLNVDGGKLAGPVMGVTALWKAN